MDKTNITTVDISVLQALQHTRFRPKDFSDAGAAKKFSEIVQGRLLYCDALGWLLWDGKRWAEDEHGATKLAIAFTEDTRAEAMKLYRDFTNYDERGRIQVPAHIKDYADYAGRLRSQYAIRAFMSLARSYLAIKAEELDAAWWILNTEAGLVDLRTGELEPHDPGALCTKIAPFSPCSDEESVNLWVRQLNLTTDGDPDYARYLQIKAGSYAFGKIFREGLDCAIGGGRNGKSTLYNALSIVLGDYAGVIDSAVLTTDRQNKGAELATLRGKRLVIAAELEEGTRMSIATVKRITSTDRIKVERKYHDPEEIEPSHHIVLFSNYLPRVGSTDSGTWRRIEVLPFNATMPDGDEDVPNYAQELADKAGGAILAWIIEGAKRFAEARYRFKRPQAVTTATDEYKRREDWLEGFIAECCIRDEYAEARAGELYELYKLHAARTGEYCRRSNDFYSAMLEKGFESVSKGGHKKEWRGLMIDRTSPLSAELSAIRRGRTDAEDEGNVNAPKAH